MSEIICADSIRTRFPVPHGSITIRPTLSIRLPSGRVVQFEYHNYLGPVFLRRDGEPRDRIFGERHPAWAAYGAWHSQGKRVDSEGNALWEAMIDSALVEETGQ